MNSQAGYNWLRFESSPYLMQHADNPVDWLPWGEEAFEKARKEDKPIFLSIGYSTCHWCHVMAHESFESQEVAEFINTYYVAVKVDKEERPDIDGVYMRACLALTGSGGWPMTIIMDQQGRPFYAGTYLPKHSRQGMTGLMELLTNIQSLWEQDKERLIKNAGEITAFVQGMDKTPQSDAPVGAELIALARAELEQSFDPRFGGFGRAPKFPMGHLCVFLLELGDEKAVQMAEKTLNQMARGGIFDQIGYGFSRYSTDNKWLAPHFEKMLYDNALLLWAYAKAYEATGKEAYRTVCEKVHCYLKREMLCEKGGFYSAQDADSDGEEGKYYLFTPEETRRVLGDTEGRVFNSLYDITSQGNFEGKNIPNRLMQGEDTFMPNQEAALYRYRKQRARLHLDDKALTGWNGLMIGALCRAYSALGDESCLQMAVDAARFIKDNAMEGGRLCVSWREGKRAGPGLLDDYALMIFGLVSLYRATLEQAYLTDAFALTDVAMEQYFDWDNGGFYTSGKENEALFASPKETHDGAMPSGNSVMMLNLVALSRFKQGESLLSPLEKQMDFLSRHARQNPSAQGFFMLALLETERDYSRLVVALGDVGQREAVIPELNKKWFITLLDEPTQEYPLLNNQTTYYLCRNRACLPPTNNLPA